MKKVVAVIMFLSFVFILPLTAMAGDRDGNRDGDRNRGGNHQNHNTNNFNQHNDHRYNNFNQHNDHRYNNFHDRGCNYDSWPRFYNPAPRYYVPAPNYYQYNQGWCVREVRDRWGNVYIEQIPCY